jgi:hypothetical protein
VVNERRHARETGTMTPAAQAVEVIELTDDDLRDAVQNALDSAGVTLEELQDQAQRGRFETEDARLAWFVVSSILDRL